MVSFGHIISAVIPVFGIMLVGWLVRRGDWIDAKGEHMLMKLVVNVFYPLMIFNFIVGNEALRNPNILFSAAFSGFLMTALGGFVCLRFAPLFGIKDPVARRTFAVTTAINNYGYLAIPVCNIVFDRTVTGVLIATNVGIELAVWSLGVLTLSGQFKLSQLRRAFSPPVIALLISAPLTLFRWDAYVPAAFIQFANIAGGAAIPVGVLMIGASLYELTPTLRSTRYWNVDLGGCVMRLLVLPLLMLAAVALLPLPLPLRQVLVIQLAMPCGIFGIVLAKHYGGNPTIATHVVMPTCLVGLITIPLWVQLGLRFL